MIETNLDMNKIDSGDLGSKINGKHDAIGRSAEEAAISHFERLGYIVGRFGVEHLVNRGILVSFYDQARSPHVSRDFLKLVRSMPDLIIARESLKDLDAQTELSLVEVKYRHTVELDNRLHICETANCENSKNGCGHPVSFHLYSGSHSRCLRCQYQRVIEYGLPTDGTKTVPGNLLFYLITDNCSLRTDSGLITLNDRIFLNLAYRPRWLHGHDPALCGKFPMYLGNGTNFAKLADEVVQAFDIAKSKL